MNDDVSEWLSDFHNDPTAARKLFDEFFDRLVRYSRSRLGGIPRRAVDEEDVALSAMKSLLMGVEQGKYELHSRDELWKLLATITVRKAIHEVRKHRTQRRGGGMVRGESVFLRQDEDNVGINEVMDAGNLPAMADHLSENCRELLDKISDVNSRNIALLRLQGYSYQEIADKQGCSLATVKRKVENIRQAWSEEFRPPPDTGSDSPG